MAVLWNVLLVIAPLFLGVMMAATNIFKVSHDDQLTTMTSYVVKVSHDDHD